MYQNILFDLDGTLTDSAEGITNSVMYALKKYGITVSDRRELYCFIGPPLLTAFCGRYGLSEADGLQAVAFYREYYREKGIFENRVYEGVVPMLSALKDAGKRVILATSKPEEFALRILEHFDLLPFFDTVAGATMDGRIGKKEDVIRYALEKAGVTDKASTVMVGDRLHDIIGARQNGLDAIGVLYGFGDEKELRENGATHIAKTPEDVVRICLE
ncbi:MAG: HAD family hydrolase [Clostridia bacterium]|nr:HAD family hydrolase [Clostridia bacterium]